MREKINRFGFLLLQPFVGLMISGTKRTRALMICDEELLLVRGWLGSQRWNMPGGGTHKGEKSKKGLKRELREELDISIQQKHLKQILKIKQDEHGARFEAIIYQINLQSKPNFKIRKSELIEAGWHKIDNLPDHLHPVVKQALKARKK